MEQHNSVSKELQKIYNITSTTGFSQITDTYLSIKWYQSIFSYVNLIFHKILTYLSNIVLKIVPLANDFITYLQEKYILRDPFLHSTRENYDY